jgi:hypothetical protein
VVTSMAQSTNPPSLFGQSAGVRRGKLAKHRVPRLQLGGGTEVPSAKNALSHTQVSRYPVIRVVWGSTH